MIFVTHIKNAGAAKDYYSQHLSPGDYYGHDAQEMKGKWHGRGAELLGLAGEVQQKDYFRLCDKYRPSYRQAAHTRDEIEQKGSQRFHL